MRFSRILFPVTIACLCLSWLTHDLSAQSLWQQRDQRKAFLFQDLKARGIGDILTIAIAEETDVANSDTRGMSKETGTSADAGFAYSGTSSGSGSASFNVNSQREFDGDVNFSSDRQFQDRFSVTVVDILPNGNLVVAGVRNVMVEGDQKRLSVSGVVRGYDIRADNSVQSSNVANLQIMYLGNGPESTFTNQGWLGRRVNKLWPF
ncbi:MAG: flagellar basal body L-ring protein FlgH [Pirellulaceae bacterium]